MKTRRDFVSNSSSCSFVILNPSDIKFDGNLVNLLASANYMHFIDVNFSCLSKIRFAGRTIAAYDKFEKEVKNAFGTKANVGFEHRDCDEVPPEEVYVELDTDNFFEKYGAKKRNVLEKLIANADAIHLNFGEDCEGGIERATQIATLLEYMYGAAVESDSDHFDYSSVDDLGIIK